MYSQTSRHIPAESDSNIVRVAVASSFRPVLEQLGEHFAAANPGCRLRFSSAASGILVAQIRSGAPYEVFVSADAARVEALLRDGLAVAGSDFTFAHGRLALVLQEPPVTDRSLPDLLLSGRLALANPAAAPYGLAAQQVLESLGLWSHLPVAPVRGTNAAQTFAMFANGGVDLALVAVVQARLLTPDRYRLVPEVLHRPIEHRAVLLRPGAERALAAALLELLSSDTAAAVLRAHGYVLPAEAGD